MPVFRLDERLVFPPPELAEDGGLLAVGGDLRTERLLLAYEQGIFPWYAEGLPILWYSPDPRMVLLADQLTVSRSLRKSIKRGRYRISFDEAFERVIRACAEVPRPGQEGTWITSDMIDAYIRLHELGLAHSCEAWEGTALAGGVYGVSLGAAFFGESMFARAPDASKVAFVTLVEHLRQWGIHLIDCQVHTEHLERFGASEWDRELFLSQLGRALDKPTRRGRWQVER